MPGRMGHDMDFCQVSDQEFPGAQSRSMRKSKDGGPLAAERLLQLVEQITGAKRATGDSLPHGSQRAIAARLHIDPSYISGFWSGTRKKSLGLTSITAIQHYAKINTEFFTRRTREQLDYHDFLLGEDPFKNGWKEADDEDSSESESENAAPDPKPVPAKAKDERPVSMARVMRMAEEKNLGIPQITALMAHIDALSKHAIVTEEAIAAQIEALAPTPAPRRPRR